MYERFIEGLTILDKYPDAMPLTTTASGGIIAGGRPDDVSVEDRCRLTDLGWEPRHLFWQAPGYDEGEMTWTGQSKGAQE